MPNSSNSEQGTRQRGLKRKTADSAVKYSSPSHLKRRRSSPESLADCTEKEGPEATSGKAQNPGSGTPPEAFKPDGNFYYDDGDIFLVVEHIFFCVHTKTLKAEGGIFQDIFSGNIRPSEGEFLYGLPVLYVPLVSLRQFRFFLAHIYGTISLRMDYPDGHCDSLLYWEAAIAVLDVSTKLNLHETRQAAISALECLFPTDRMDGQIPKFQPVIAGCREQSDEQIFRRTFPIQAINLFHDHGVPSMLPMAYYHATQLSLEDIVNGVKNGDVLWKLDSDDILKVLKGRNKLKISRRQVLFPWLDDKMTEGSATCEREIMLNGNYCWENFMEIYTQFNRSGFLDDNTNGLQCLTETAENLFPGYVCQGCWSDTLTLMDIGKQKNWKNLAEYFGFEDWDAVKKLQENIDRSWEGKY